MRCDRPSMESAGPGRLTGITLPLGMRLVKIWLACAALLACAAPAAADSRVTQTLAEDAKLYFTAPIRWDGRDWLHAGETLAVIGLAHQYDDDVRTHFVAGMDAPLSGRDPHSARDALPAATI